MPDSAEQLARLYQAGFDIQTFDRYPKAVGVLRGDCVALMIPGAGGLQMLGVPGWRMGDVLGVLTEREGKRIFQFKENVIEATPERLALLAAFTDDIRAILAG